jgi:hypothetical protein
MTDKSSVAATGRVPRRFIQGESVGGKPTWAEVVALQGEDLNVNVEVGATWDLPAARADAFGRLRVSEPATIFDGKSILDAQPFLFDDAATSGAGTGTSHAGASVTLSVGNLTAGTRVRQSKRRMAYQPGKSQFALITFTLGAQATGITRRVGLFDEDNGVFLEQAPGAVSWVVRNNGLDTNAATQASWNLDTLDGSADAGNPSGILLDLEQAQIAAIDFERLGVGTVRVGFVVDGALVYVHAFHHANAAPSVYMLTPNLPVRWELANDGDGGAATLETICASVMSEGGQQQTGLTRTVDRASTPLTTLNDSDLYPLIAIRLDGMEVAATVRAKEASVFCPTGATFRWALLLNPSVAGTALSFSDVANSAVEADVARTNGTKVTGGTLLASGYGSSTAQVALPSTGATDYALGATIAGVSDILVLAVQRLSGTTEDFYGTLTYTEQV